MKGKLFIIEGGDGSGKATQTRLLTEHLQRDGYDVKSVSYPDYDSDSSALVKMYLRGDFGSDADAVQPFAQVTGRDHVVDVEARRAEEGYQMIKIDDPAQRRAYLAWLEDFEFRKMGLPAPDKVFLLDVPLAVTERLMADRTGKTGGQTGDIHEKNEGFLAKCHAAYDELAQRYHWQRIACTEGGAMRTPEAIHQDLYVCLFTL